MKDRLRTHMKDRLREYEPVSIEITIAHLSQLCEVNENAMVQRHENPHSFRGYYGDLALEPVVNEQMTVKELLNLLKGCVGDQYEGWKGGLFVMTLQSDVYSAHEGETNGSVPLITAIKSSKVAAQNGPLKYRRTCGNEPFEAYQLGHHEIPQWYMDIDESIIHPELGGGVSIETHLGLKHVRLNDWVTRNDSGVIMPVSKSEFNESFKPVDPHESKHAWIAQSLQRLIETGYSNEDLGIYVQELWEMVEDGRWEDE